MTAMIGPAGARHARNGNRKRFPAIGRASYSLCWAPIGAAILLVLTLFVFHFQTESVSLQLASRVKCQAVISQILLHLLSAVEAGNKAVFALHGQEILKRLPTKPVWRRQRSNACE